MLLAETIAIYAGGPGSGCNPTAGKCGRPGGKLLRPVLAIVKKKMAAVGFSKDVLKTLSKVKLKAETRLKGERRSVHALYEYKKNLISIATEYSPKSSIPDGELASTLLHEYGHVLQNRIYDALEKSGVPLENELYRAKLKADREYRIARRNMSIAPAWQRSSLVSSRSWEPSGPEIDETLDKAKAVSGYAVTDNVEWYAESFALFADGGAGVLKRRAPATYALVKSIATGGKLWEITKDLNKVKE